MPKELAEAKPMPESLRRVWPIFLDLAATRPYEQGVPLPIRETEIMAWCANRGRRLSFGTLQALRMLDAAWIRVMTRAAKAAQP